MAIQMFRETLEPDPTNRSSESLALKERVEQALAQKVEKEQLRMVNSVAKYIAYDVLRADLDARRSGEAVRAALKTFEMTIEGLAVIDEMAQAAMTRQPDLEADIAEMMHPLREKMKGTPTLVYLANLGRNFNLR